MDDKERILAHVSEKFLAEGFQKTSMDEIASDLKMSKKTIYKYFSSKDELLFTTVDKVLNSTRAAIEKILDSEDNSLAKLERITQLMLKMALRLNQRFLSDLQIYKPDLWQKIDEFRSTAFFTNFGRLFDQCKNENIISDHPNVIILKVMLSSIQGVINPAFLMENNFSAHDAGKIVFDIIFGGLLTKKGRKLLKK